MTDHTHADQREGRPRDPLLDRADDGGARLGSGSAPSYAVGILTRVDLNDEVVDYLRRIDETLAPFDGRFLIHGARAQEKEGTWPGGLIVIEFPESDGAAAWYDSDAYQAIIPLRARNADGLIALFDGVVQPHRGVDVLQGAGA